jgi:hypothetical protein
MKKIIILTLVLLSTIIIHAQVSAGLNTAFGDKKNATHLWGRYEWGFGKQKAIRVGGGLRFSHFNAYKGLYLTAPVRLTQVNYSPDNANIDTLRIAESRHFFTNLYLILGYTFKEKLDLRFSIDLAGVSFGSTVSAEHITNYKANPNPKHTTVNAKPTALNLLLVSDNDIGSLNSEFTAGYWINKKYLIFGGYSFLFAEYTTEKAIRNDNQRFRLKGHLGTIGVAYRIR